MLGMLKRSAWCFARSKIISQVLTNPTYGHSFRWGSYTLDTLPHPMIPIRTFFPGSTFPRAFARVGDNSKPAESIPVCLTKSFRVMLVLVLIKAGLMVLVVIFIQGIIFLKKGYTLLPLTKYFF